MPYSRRSTGKRKRPWVARQLAFRIGNINAAGGKDISPTTITINSVTANTMQTSSVTAGNTCAFNIAEWSAPADPVANGGWVFPGTEHNKPNVQPEADGQGYDTSRVLSSMYRFDVAFTNATSTPKKDFYFAYAFNDASDAALVLTASAVVATDNWNDLRTSKGWVWHRMSATAGGGSVYPSHKRIEVKIPSVYKLAKSLRADVEDVTIADYTAPITAGVDVVAEPCFLHIVVATLDGTAFAIGDVRVDIIVYQKVILKKLMGNLEIIEEQVPET